VVQEALVSLESRCTGESTSGRIHPLRTHAHRGKLRVRGNGFSRQIHGGGAAMRMAAGPKDKVDGGRASSSIGRSSRAAGLFPVGGRSGSAAGLLPFGGVSGPAAPLFPISGGNGEHQHRPHPWLHPARPNPPLSAASLATAGASLIISRCF